MILANFSEVVRGGVFLIKVRTPIEYGANHIKNALNIDVSSAGNIERAFEKRHKDKTVYLYCGLVKEVGER